MGGAMFALAGVKAVMQIGQGYAENAEAKYNASLLENKAMLMDVQSNIEQGRYTRAKGQALSSSMASVAGMGVMPSGSPMAVVLANQTQMGIDQIIAKFNADEEKRYTLAEADSLRRAGKRARTAGYMDAFSTMLQAGSNYALSQRKYPKLTQAGTVKDTTFDSAYRSSTPKYSKGYSKNYLKSVTVNTW